MMPSLTGRLRVDRCVDVIKDLKVFVSLKKFSVTATQSHTAQNKTGNICEVTAQRLA